ncbi:hypothetical protein ACWEJS_14325 [Rhodococcus triatomae]
MVVTVAVAVAVARPAGVGARVLFVRDEGGRSGGVRLGGCATLGDDGSNDADCGHRQQNGE